MMGWKYYQKLLSSAFYIIIKKPIYMYTGDACLEISLPRDSVIACYAPTLSHNFYYYNQTATLYPHKLFIIYLLFS